MNKTRSPTIGFVARSLASSSHGGSSRPPQARTSSCVFSVETPSEPRLSGLAPHPPAYWYRPVRLRNGRIAYVRSYIYWADPFYNDVWTHRYLEGALTMDVIERDTGRLVYRAQVIDTIGNNLEKYVTKSVDRAFKKFPVKELED